MPRLVLMLPLALGACATAPRSTTPPLPPELAPAEVARAASPAVVLLVAERPDGALRVGSALLLEGQGLPAGHGGFALTSLALVAGASRLEAHLGAQASSLSAAAGEAREAEARVGAAQTSSLSGVEARREAEARVGAAQTSSLSGAAGGVEARREAETRVGAAQTSSLSGDTGNVEARSAQISSFLAAHAGELVGATLVRGDPERGLAVVRLDADTRGRPRLPWRDAPAQPGERVVAVGARPFGFVGGTVSAATPDGITTDAALEGAPVLDLRGRVIGLATGAVARPIFMAKSVADEASATVALDRRTPESTARTCLRLLELGRDELADCLDAENELAVLEAQRRARLARLTAEQRRAAEAMQPALDAKLIRARVRHELGTGLPARATSSAEELARRLAQPTSDTFEPDARALERGGLRVDGRNPRSRYDALRLGVRIERVERTGDRGWALLTGKNLDGSPFRVTWCLVLRADQWQLREAPTADDVARLPKPGGQGSVPNGGQGSVPNGEHGSVPNGQHDFPMPLETFDEAAAR